MYLKSKSSCSLLNKINSENQYEKMCAQFFLICRLLNTNAFCRNTNFSQMSVDWTDSAVKRIEKREYEKRSRFMSCTPRVHRDRNNHDVLVTHTDGGRRTNICVTCFSFSGKIRVACAQGHGGTGLIFCNKHRIIGTGTTQSAAPTVPTADIAIVPEAALVNKIPPIQYERLRKIVTAGVFYKMIMFRDEEYGKTIMKEDGYPVHVFPSGHTEPLCAACLCFSQVVRPVYREVSEGFCYRHYNEKQKSGAVWPSEDVHEGASYVQSLRVELSSPPTTKAFLALSSFPRTNFIKSHVFKDHPFKYKMEMKRVRKIARRLQVGGAPVRTDRISPNSCPYIHRNGELKQWDGITSTRICEECYSKKNVMRLTKGGLSRLCGAHTK